MRELSGTPSVVPTADATVYIVLDDFGKSGAAYRETDINECDRRTLIDDLIRGQFENPLQIIAFNVSEGWSRDVTKDIAREAIEVALRQRTWLGSSARRFIEVQTGEDVPGSLVNG